VATVATRREKKRVPRNNKRIHLTPTGLLMEGVYTQNHSVMNVIGTYHQ
jgi:hypothetical protein